ncbi:MAG: glycosyltransferase, partial [Patescibacteria group bacterium]
MKKKILLVLSTEKFSGGEKVALDIAKSLKFDFDFVFFLPSNPSKEFEEELKDFKVYFPSKKSFLGIIRNLKKTIFESKPSIVHAHGTRAGIFLKVTLFFTFRKNFKFIYTLHGIHFIRRKFPFNFIFLFLEVITNNLFVDYLTCVGKDDYNLAKKLRLIKNSKLLLIENGINLEKYRNIKRGYLRNNFELKNKIILATICRLGYQKDLKTLIKAIYLLKNEN